MVEKLLEERKRREKSSLDRTWFDPANVEGNPAYPSTNPVASGQAAIDRVARERPGNARAASGQRGDTIGGLPRSMIRPKSAREPEARGVAPGVPFKLA
jgi:hypothetical protein